jgi:hypothetical protein
MSTVLVDQITCAGRKASAALDAPPQHHLQATSEFQWQASDSETWDSEPVPTRDDEGSTPAPCEPARLDEAIAGAWRRLELGEAVSCPVCGGWLDLYRFDEIETREGFCADCGSELS